jgi:hypothetical protein
MKWTPLDFGKHEGKTIPQVLFKDPDWFYWALVSKRIFDQWTEYKDQAYEAYRRSRNIRIPIPNKKVEYVFDGVSGKFADLKLVDENVPRHVGTSITYRKDKIDMFAVRESKYYDKLGNELMLSAIKQILFGDNKYRMTKKRCEDFFNDDNNFIL